MGRARKVAPSGMTRSGVRASVRAGLSRKDAADRALQLNPNLNQNALNKMITEEQNRQRGVDAIMNMNKSRSVQNLSALARCPQGSTLRASIVLEFTDTVTGRDVRYNGVVDLGNSGRLSTILNTALQTVIDAAVANKYNPPAITSANRTAGGSYRLDYVECT